MNEMRLLEEFCAQEPSPSPQRLARARARVMESISGGRAPATRRRVRREGRRRTGVLARPWLATVIATGTVAAVAVAATVALNTGLFQGGAHGRTGAAGTVPQVAAPPPGASGTQLAAYVLDRAADAALTAPAPSDGQFIYTDTHRVDPEGHGLWANQQTWQSVDGQHPGAMRVGKCLSPTLFRKPVPAKIPPPWIIPSCLFKIPALHHTGHNSVYFDRTYAGLRALPTDPRVLLTYLEHHNSCDTQAGFGLPTTVAAYAEIYMILDSVQVLPPKVGAALFRAAAMIPGITVRKNAANAAGGHGLAVSLSYGPGAGTPVFRHELFFAPQTYRFLGSQRVAVSSGALVGASWLRSYRIVNSAPTSYTAGKNGGVIYAGGTSTSCE